MQWGKCVRGGPHRPDSDPLTGAGGARGAGAVSEVMNPEDVPGVLRKLWLFSVRRTGHGSQQQ